jgi:hypothetical protein
MLADRLAARQFAMNGLLIWSDRRNKLAARGNWLRQAEARDSVRRPASG